jgi:hypothetical protein
MTAFSLPLWAPEGYDANMIHLRWEVIYEKIIECLNQTNDMAIKVDMKAVFF